MDSFVFPITWVELTEALVRANHGDVEQIFIRCQLSPSIIHQPEASITLAQFTVLLQIILEQVSQGNEPRSLQILRYMPTTFFGAIGVAAMTAKTLSDALDVAVCYFPLYLPTIELYLEKVGKRTYVHARSNHDFGSPYNELLIEIVFGSICKCTFFAKRDSEFGTSSYSSCMDVHLRHISSEDSEAFRTFYGMPVKFGSIENLFIASQETLSFPMKTRNRTTHIALKRVLEQRLQVVAGLRTVTLRVHRMLTISLLRGEFPSVEDIATHFAMSSRTLNRRLLKEGSSMAALMDEVRTERAKMLLVNSDFSLGTIASKLGYSDSSTFSRAFKRITGLTPSELRTVPSEA